MTTRRRAPLFCPLAGPLVLAMCLATNASSTTFPTTTEASLLEKSDVVVIGKVARCDARLVDAHGLRIVTFCDVRVEDVVDTSESSTTNPPLAGDVVVVAVPGGELGDIGQHVAGAPEILAKSRWLLLLGEANGPNRARGVVGLSLGAIELVDDPSSVAPRLVSDATRLAAFLAVRRRPQVGTSDATTPPPTPDVPVGIDVRP